MATCTFYCTAFTENYKLDKIILCTRKGCCMLNLPDDSLWTKVENHLALATYLSLMDGRKACCRGAFFIHHKVSSYLPLIIPGCRSEVIKWVKSLHSYNDFLWSIYNWLVKGIALGSNVYSYDWLCIAGMYTTCNSKLNFGLLFIKQWWVSRWTKIRALCVIMLLGYIGHGNEHVPDCEVTAIYSGEWGEIITKQLCKWVLKKLNPEICVLKLLVEHSTICMIP